MSAEAAKMAEEMEREVKQTAWANLTAYEAEVGEAVPEKYHDAFDVGVGYGFLATMQVFMRHGLLPGGER